MNIRIPALLLFWIFSSSIGFAQNVNPDSLQSMVNQQVSDFLASYWDAYNSCQVEKILSLESDTMEFYHDLGGLSVGKENSRESWEQFCSNTEWRTNAEWEGAYEISTMFQENQLYGAMVIGNLKFNSIRLSDNKKFEVGKSRFVVFLSYDQNSWKMHRVFSFDHQPIQ
ncbi:hypothetical protein E4S40_06150 [Algoriphagus kandeliae]|uniref:Nuclear transport factor 2 family protein n=1 Tax=Algoriphagus kandeliae TaxID=2562278 RepID=A0A4Y9QW67_9BACT|nr:hypothetical protein [Algoriphagus kandeliae]TFV95802.1 hypothetical protein E4S40_06150 [Algoriphagus kandeliae]